MNPCGAGSKMGKLRRASKPYKLKPVRMGEPRSDFNLTKALALADNLEDSRIAYKLALRK